MATMGTMEVIMVAMVMERTFTALPWTAWPMAAASAPWAAMRSAKLASLMMDSSTLVIGLRSESVMYTKVVYQSFQWNTPKYRAMVAMMGVDTGQ